MSEHLHQVSFINWFRKDHPGVLIFAIPNGGARHPKVAEKLRDEGATPGIPDLYIPIARTWIEMKTEKGSLSKEQENVIKYLTTIGDTVIIGYGFEDAKQKIREIMG